MVQRGCQVCPSDLEKINIFTAKSLGSLDKCGESAYIADTADAGGVIAGAMGGPALSGTTAGAVGSPVASWGAQLPPYPFIGYGGRVA